MIIYGTAENGKNAVLIATCTVCGQTKSYEMDENETKTLKEYQLKGRSMGSLSSLFPKIPAWILSGAVDEDMDGNCICPKCQNN